RGAGRDALGQFIPAGLLFRAEVRTVKKLLQPKNLYFFPGCIGDQALVLGDHLLFDFAEGKFFRGPLTSSLNQAATDHTGHVTPPEQQAKSLLRRPSAYKVLMENSKWLVLCGCSCIRVSAHGKSGEKVAPELDKNVRGKGSSDAIGLQ